MPTSLLKLVMTATQPITTTEPTIYNFFHTVPPGGYTGSATYTIDDVDWLDDGGDPVAVGGLVTAAPDNGYYQLVINGQIQEGDVITSVTPNDVTITFDEVTDIEEGKIIVLTVVNFAPETTAPIITG